MKLKKTLVTLSAATAVALAGAPAAHAAETSAPAATATAEAPAAGSDSGSSEKTGALKSSETPGLEASVNGSFGWDENTTGFDKFLTIFEGAIKIAKLALGIPDLGSVSGSYK